MTYDPNLSASARQQVPETKEVSTSVSTESSSALSAGSLNASDASRVDQALNSLLEHRNDTYVEPKETLSALQAEVDSLRYRALDEVRFRIRKNPWHAVGIGAFAGFLFGITR
ncbi:hypothetical protein [Rhizobium sp.]|uniref:hypothetical protein n=1 Tax=Rhizobium sp. TaxID=391 RepID=UPI0028A87D4F